MHQGKRKVLHRMKKESLHLEKMRFSHKKDIFTDKLTPLMPKFPNYIILDSKRGQRLFQLEKKGKILGEEKLNKDVSPQSLGFSKLNLVPNNLMLVLVV